MAARARAGLMRPAIFEIHRVMQPGARGSKDLLEMGICRRAIFSPGYYFVDCHFRSLRASFSRFFFLPRASRESPFSEVVAGFDDEAAGVLLGDLGGGGRVGKNLDLMGHMNNGWWII